MPNNAARITDFRVDAVAMPQEKYYALPVDARVLIHAYCEKFRQDRDGLVHFEIPVYRWDEIREAIKS